MGTPKGAAAGVPPRSLLVLIQHEEEQIMNRTLTELDLGPPVPFRRATVQEPSGRADRRFLSLPVLAADGHGVAVAGRGRRHAVLHGCDVGLCPRWLEPSGSNSIAMTPSDATSRAVRSAAVFVERRRVLPDTRSQPHWFVHLPNLSRHPRTANGASFR